MTSDTYGDGAGRERYSKCMCLVREAHRCWNLPPQGCKPSATPDELLTVACPLCSAPAGEPCDRSYYKIFTIWAAFPGFGLIHVARYLARVRGTDPGNAKQAAPAGTPSK